MVLILTQSYDVGAQACGENDLVVRSPKKVQENWAPVRNVSNFYWFLGLKLNAKSGSRQARQGDF